MDGSTRENTVSDLDERVAKIELRMKTHWALQSDQEFAETYVQRVRNDLTQSIAKMALGAVVLLAGSGFVFIKYAVNEQFSTENGKLIKKLEGAYDEKVEMTDSNFEWRRFHDYGKDYVNLAELYSLAPLETSLRDEKVRSKLDEAARYFRKALAHGNMHASTYWELGELLYSYPLKMHLSAEVDRKQAIQHYLDAVDRYTKVEIAKGWRAEASYKVGAIYWELHGMETDEKKRANHREEAKRHLIEAKNGYAKIADQRDERTQSNIAAISRTLAAIEGTDSLPAASSAPQRKPSNGAPVASVSRDARAGARE
jgi:hypothetical protein